MMRFRISLSPIFKTKWYEYAIRFCLGGLITVAAGLITEKWGPQVGGLFLAFPAILPASVTLIEKHEKRAKQQKGLTGAARAKSAAAVDAAGASIGSIGLLVFALAGSVFSFRPLRACGSVAWNSRVVPHLSSLLEIAEITLARGHSDVRSQSGVIVRPVLRNLPKHPPKMWLRL
jgi:Protein of unknown function (DUF3147)